MMRAPYPVVLAAAAILAIVSQGSSAGGMPPARGLTAAAQDDSAGRRLYLKNCRQCHGATGEPSSETKHKYPKIKALNDSALMARIPDDSVLAVMKHGAGKDMKAFGDRLNHEEMEAILKYVRTLPSKKSK